MPRPNRGFYLKLHRQRGWARALYVIQGYEGGRQVRRSTGTGDRGAAETALAEFLLERGRARRVAGPRDPDQILIADIIDAYLTERAATQADAARAAMAAGHLLDWWARTPVGAITPTACQRYAAWRREERAAAEAERITRQQASGRDPRPARPLADATVARELSVLAAAVGHAWREARITRLVPVWRPEAGEPRQRWLTREEAGRLIQAAQATPHLELFVRLALGTGARSRALLRLRWSQVDLVQGRIDLHPPGARRTAKANALIPIPPGLGAALHAAHAAARTEAERAERPPPATVIAYQGRAVVSIKRAFATACRAAGIDGATPHTLRHTVASWLMQAGVPTAEAARWLGHAQQATTEGYQHHGPDYLRRAAAALDWP